MNLKLLITPVLVLSVFFSGATNYYIDASAGSDINSGRSPQNAWQSIEKLNYTQFNPGDSILFKRGETFRGNLKAQGGEPGNHVVYGAFGIGSKPKILGSSQRNAPEFWQNTGNNIWETSANNTETTDIELLPNGSANNNLSGWHSWNNSETGANITLTRTTKANEYYDSPAGLKLECSNNGNSIFDIQLFTNGWNITESKWYKLTFFARASKPFSLETDDLNLMQMLSPFTEYSYKKYAQNLDFTNSWKEYKVYFRVNKSANNCRLTIFLGNKIPDNSVLFLDAFSLKECLYEPEYLDSDVGNLILNYESLCGTKVWNENDLTSQGDFCYDAENHTLKMYSELNPADYYSSVELAKGSHLIEYYYTGNTTIENLDLRYGPLHGINCVDSHDLTVSGVDFSFIGGGTLSVDTNNERLGNGIQFWMNAQDIVVEKCSFYQLYDAAITPQGSSSEEVNINRLYLRNNIISNCEYSFEFWESGDNINLSDVYFENNTCLYAGGGWSHVQRPDPNGTHLMFFANDANCSNFFIRNNIFYQASDWLVRWSRTSNLNDATIDYNCWYSETGAIARVKDDIYSLGGGLDNLISISGHAVHAIASNPLLDENNLLASHSPCIQKGAIINTVTDDFYGFPRLDNSNYDLGAVNANSIIVFEDVEICNGESYNGFIQTGKYRQNLATGDGKDSVVITNLVVYPNPLPGIKVEGNTLKSNAEFTSYQWYDDNGIIPEGNSGELEITKSGNYYLEITDEHGCSGITEKVYVFFSGNNTLKENKLEFSIMPNPNNGDFLFRFDSGQGKELKICIINSLGQTIATKTILQPTENQTIKFSIPQLKSGIYNLKVVSEEFENIKKFVVY